jgi:hypothetical protein
LQTYYSTLVTTYSCTLGTLDSKNSVCKMPPLTATPTVVATLVCGTNAILNSSGQCAYVAIPAINVGGAYSCPALYVVGTGADAGWCIPTAQWAYSATWNLNQYDCPNGGSLGMIADPSTGLQVPNGLCYLP